MNSFIPASGRPVKPSELWKSSMKTILSAAASVCLLAACATPQTAIVAGNKRPPIDPATVRLYLDPPKRFEKVALIDANSKNAPLFSSMSKADLVVLRLKEQAAGLGANGVLIQQSGDQITGAVMPSSGRFGMIVPVTQRSGSGVAIFVYEE